MIVSGTQQAIALIADVLANAGDTVAIEEPHYSAIRRVLPAHGGRMHAAAVDHEGLVCDELPPDGAKLACVTPSHQFPTGAVMSLRRRATLLDYASRHDPWIFEDDYDGELLRRRAATTANPWRRFARSTTTTGSFTSARFPRRCCRRSDWAT